MRRHGIRARAEAIRRQGIFGALPESSLREAATPHIARGRRAGSLGCPTHCGGRGYSCLHKRLRPWGRELGGRPEPFALWQTNVILTPLAAFMLRARHLCGFGTLRWHRVVGVTLRFRTFVSPAPINNSGEAFLTQVVALAEPVQSVLRERRVVRYRIVGRQNHL